MSHEGVGAPGGVDEGGQMSDLDGVDSLVELLQYRGKYLRSQLNEESSTRTKQYNSGHLALYEACRDVASYMDSDTIREEEVLQVSSSKGGSTSRTLPIAWAKFEGWIDKPTNQRLRIASRALRAAYFCVGLFFAILSICRLKV